MIRAGLAVGTQCPNQHPLMNRSALTWWAHNIYTQDILVIHLSRLGITTTYTNELIWGCPPKDSVSPCPPYIR